MSVVDQETRNEAVVRRAFEEMDKHNVSVVDELFAADLVDHPLWYQPSMPPSMAGKPFIEAMKEFLGRPDPDYENVHTNIDQLISAGDKVVTVWTTIGTRNGKQVSRTGIEIDRLVDGKVAETWWQWDRLGLFQQLGVVPATRELVEQAGLKM